MPVAKFKKNDRFAAVVQVVLEQFQDGGRFATTVMFPDAKKVTHLWMPVVQIKKAAASRP